MSFGKNDITGAVSGFTGIYVWDAQGRLKVIGGGSPPPPAPVVWGTITGLVTNQTDLITYLGLNFYPLSSNPAGYLTQLVADGLYYPLASNPAGYLDQIAADLLYYPLSSNPAGYLTQTAADLLYYPLSTNPANYIDLTDLSGGTGISYNNLTGVITNSAPDQVVVLTGGTGISTSGTYPSFTITNTLPDQTVSLSTTGTGLAVTGTYPSFTLENTLPDQTVAISAGTGISVSGTYPSFTITNTSTGGGGLTYAVASGTNTYTATIPGVTAYTAGDVYAINFTNGNDDDSTININGLGAQLLVKEFDVQLTGGDIVSGQELILIYDGTNFQCIGVAPNQLFVFVTNDDSVTITKGQPVYAFGSAGNRMSVKLAYNTSDATSAQTIGLVFSTSIAAGQKGFIITQGVISGVNTGAYSPGDTLYLGATAGTLTSTKPFAPNHLVYIGTVERANAGNGQIYVRPQNGYEMNEIHDVQSNGAVNKDVLYRDTTVTPNLWKPASVPSLSGTFSIGATIDGSGGTITVGQKGYVQVPYACTINSWRIIANASGSIVIDIWKAAAPTIPTVANTITAAAIPGLSSQQTNASSTLTGWTTSIAANDIIGFNVNSATTVSWVILQLLVTKI